MNREFVTGPIEVLDDVMVDVFKAKSPAEKIELIAAANRTARILAAAGARHLHPDWNEQQIRAEVARRVGGTT